MSSNQGNKIDRYEIFRIRQGMRPRSNGEAYFDCSGSPMIVSTNFFEKMIYKVRIVNSNSLWFSIFVYQLK